MKLDKKTIEAGLLLALFFVSFYVWTLPFQKNQLPYGDVDSSTHFALADYMGQTDTPLHYLPYYLGVGGFKDDGQGKIWYPPQYHLTAAVLQLIVKERVLPILLFNAIASMAVAFTSYFLMRRLYGVTAGLLTGFAMIFSLRDIMWFMWGQYPQVLSFGLIPLILHLLYSYLESLLDKENRTYLYFYAIVLVVQFLVHPQGWLISLAISGIYSIIFIIKNKISLNKLKTVVPAVLILFLLLIPFLKIPFGGYGVPYRINLEKLDSLKHWYGSINESRGVPDAYYSFNAMIGSWTLPLLFIGIAMLLLRRNNKDLLLLVWLLVFYIATHDFILGTSRAERFMETEAQVLFPIIVVGLLSIPKLIKLPSNIKKYAAAGLIFLFVIIFWQQNAENSINSLRNAYPGILRVTPAQYEAAEWILQNLPEDADVIISDTMFYTKKKWYQAIAQRHHDRQNENMEHVPWNPDADSVAQYILIDYSDLALTGNQPAIQGWQQWESQNQNNTQLIYNRNNIRVFKFG